MFFRRAPKNVVFTEQASPFFLEESVEILGVSPEDAWELIYGPAYGAWFDTSYVTGHIESGSALGPIVGEVHVTVRQVDGAPVEERVTVTQLDMNRSATVQHASGVSFRWSFDWIPGGLLLTVALPSLSTQTLDQKTRDALLAVLKKELSNYHRGFYEFAQQRANGGSMIKGQP